MDDFINYLCPGDYVTLSEKGLDHFEYWDDPKPTKGFVTVPCNVKYIHVKLPGMNHTLGYRRDFWVLA